MANRTVNSFVIVSMILYLETLALFGEKHYTKTATVKIVLKSFSIGT